MALHNLFPTPVFEGRAPNASRLNQRILSDLEALEILDQAGVRWSRKNYKGGYTSYGSVTDLHRRFPAFEDLEALLTPHARRYAATLGLKARGRTLIMTTCWVSRMPRRTRHVMHDHPLCVISGTYYVSVPRGTSSLRFEDPRKELLAAPPKIQALPPATGRFYLFPHWLRHEVPPNPVAGDRVSVSFNYEFSRR